MNSALFCCVYIDLTYYRFSVMIFDLFKRDKQASDMWLFVGLGNPGDKYARAPP